ncbi:MAG: UDP-2,4-diacetamido-2,4,6-trideoxy-beta-L-altropyranose hydrolase [Halanaerobium sp.]|nr:UDP-2,4-diacetamido-2,4,6-trideoxy-beta-L-altropyranose hydrolase [Halanaerobium sp.]
MGAVLRKHSIYSGRSRINVGEVKKIAIRVDGGTEIGMGHLMRCLALASRLKEEAQVTFLTRREDSAIRMITRYGFPLHLLPTDLSYTAEIPLVRHFLTKGNYQIIITDSYNLAQDYLLQIREVVNKLVSIHDYVPFAFPSDILINGNIYAPELAYESLTGQTKFLLGTDYTLLREEFQKLPRRNISERVQKVLVTMGGSDLLNLTPKIIRILTELKKPGIELKYCDLARLHIDVVIGPAFDNREDVIKEVERAPYEVSLHFNYNMMSSLFLECDLAVSAAGSTLYELAVTGTPGLSLLQAENQELAAKKMEEAGCNISLGYGDQVVPEEVQEGLVRLIEDWPLRIKMSKSGQALVDGRGVERCVQNILQG